MIEQETFEDALIADPSDVTTRLVYADWLEERGFNHRAKYLREIRKSKFIRRVDEMGRYALAPYPDLPPKVQNVTQYWVTAPPELSARCIAVVARLKAGWRVPHIYELGYHTRAEAYGVYIWELFNVIDRLHMLLENG